MPSEQINFRHTAGAGEIIELTYELQKAGKLTGGFMHFPPGCNSVVQVRILVGRDAKHMQQLTPIDDQYIALDDANWEFALDEKVGKKDKIYIQIRNTGAESHRISTIITQWYPSPEERVEALKQRRLGR